MVALAAQGNQAAYGGGVFLQDGRAQVVNTLLAGNYAAGSGGGLYAANSTVRMVNITAAANRADVRGGGLLLEIGASIVNALIGGNSAASDAQIGGNATTVQYSLVQDGCSGGVSCVDNVQTGDPRLVSGTKPRHCTDKPGRLPHPADVLGDRRRQQRCRLRSEPAGRRYHFGRQLLTWAVPHAS